MRVNNLKKKKKLNLLLKINKQKWRIYPFKIHANNEKGIQLSQKLHDVDLSKALDRVKKTTRAYAWRKWNGKLGVWEMIYKDHPPKDPFYNR